MTNEMKLQNEVLTMETLDRVSGGTVGELEDLTKAIVSNPTLKKLGSVDAHIPGANRIIANEVENILQKNLKIDADISLGLFGTGAGSKNNTYRDMTNGQYISHQEVLNRLAKFQ